MELSERKKRILSAIVEQYIATGEPVGSKVLCAALGVSSATVRNEMSELAEMGLLDQPHTSAGRIPSHIGYRYYIDNLMNRYELGEEQRRRMEAQMMLYAGDPEQLLEQAGEILASITNCAAVTTTPKDESAVVRKVDIIPMGSNTVMLMLVTSTGTVRTRGYKMRASEVTPELLEVFYSVTDHVFIGKSVADINLSLIKRLTPLLGDNAVIIQEILIALAELAWDAAKEEILLEGQTNLLNHREYDDNAYELLSFLKQGDSLSSLFSAQDSGAIHVIIGRETEIPQLENSSVIMARYQVSGHRGGTLGIIGPTRIDYAKLIPNIEYLTSLVGRLLSDAFGEGNQLATPRQYGKDGNYNE